MRRMIFLAIGLFLFSIPSFAQEVIYPKAEVFGGFSISSAAVGTVDPTTGLPVSLRKIFGVGKGPRTTTSLTTSGSWVISVANTKAFLASPFRRHN